MSSTDWRALCQELASWIERATRNCFQGPEVLDRARAALAQPEPEVVGLTDEELANHLISAGVDAKEGESDGTGRMYWEGWNEQVMAAMRAAITDDRARFGRPAQEPAEPEISAEEAAMIAAPWSYLNPPQAGAGEVGELVAALRNEAIDCACTTLTSGDLRRIADLLEQRQGAPVPVAVAVSERLPQPEDCDAEGMCWWWYPPVPEQNYGYWLFEDDATDRAYDEWPSAWLPFNALPLPTSEPQP